MSVILQKVIDWWHENKYQVIIQGVIFVILIFILIPWVVGALTIIKYFLYY